MTNNKSTKKMQQKEFLNLVMPFKDKLFRMAKRLLVSREEAEDLGIWPKIAFCVPYSGKYYSISEMTGKNAINVSSRSRMDFIDFLPVKCINEDV